MERNYKEDQANEIEALESIYCDDIQGINFCICLVVVGTANFIVRNGEK